jgi:hypothetical protein
VMSSLVACYSCERSGVVLEERFLMFFVRLAIDLVDGSIMCVEMSS